MSVLEENSFIVLGVNYYLVFGLADPPSPTLEAAHLAATVSKRFESWLKRACKNFDKLLELKAIVDHTLRRERLEELTGDERNRLLDAVEEYDKLEDSLAKFVKSKAYEDFRGWSWNEDLIKWAGQERVSVGYCGSRERGKQYLIMDIPLESDLPYEKKVADLLELYRVPSYLRIPTQDEAERSLLEFLEWVKEWPRDRVVWAVKSLYPLSDKTGGFWSVVTKVLALESLKEAWEDVIEGWTREITSELKRMAQFEVLKTILMAEYEAERYIEREIIPKLKEEFLQKYGETTQDPAWVRAAFSERAVEVFMERVPVEAEIVEVYEQIKPLIPAGKVELTKAGLHKAIRWTFLHPEMSLDAFASGHVFPLDFTTEEARAIASKILEKVTKKPLPKVKSYDELKREFEGKDLVDALAIYVSRYRVLQRDYLLEDLHRFFRELKAKLSDEDIHRFYKVYPNLTVSFVSIASLISWIPPPPTVPLEQMARDALKELEEL